LPIVGQLLGHTAWTTTQRYAHLAHDPVEQGAELVGEAIKVALGG
jgi:site-specific recombinase XerD